ncbi:MAG: DUF4143 domain-containing protein [Candidatus Methanoplasma sp.]|jgi:predicted AAA+ superfamily ATPase|nr:DUF4143 domain-containing protein [Candidatus Methanoplasma sp.]
MKDIAGESEAVPEYMVRSCMDALRKIFILSEQNAWLPPIRSRARIRTTPKRHLIDPSLAAAAMGAGPEKLMGDPNTVGLLFESMCYRDLKVYSSAMGGDVLYYRDNTDLEIDAVIDLPDGRWGAVEVKLGETDFDKAAANLLRLREKTDPDREPSFLAILTATSKYAYTRKDGAVVIPADLLGP